jgi:hypothetical protein
MMRIDNPLNGYLEGFEEGGYLGMFVLSPGAMMIRNKPPGNEEIRFKQLVENIFLDYDNL